MYNYGKKTLTMAWHIRAALFLLYGMRKQARRRSASIGDDPEEMKMKKLLCMLLCALFLLTACSSKPKEDNKTSAAGEGPAPASWQIRYEGAGFDTPEDAVLYYLAGLKNLDIEQMLGAFAWETQAEHYSFRDCIIRSKGIDPWMVPGMPFSGDLLKSAGVEQLRGAQTNSIYIALEIYILGEKHFSNTSTNSIPLREEAEADDYLKLYESDRIQKLKSIANVRFYSPDDVTEGRFSLPKMQENFEKQNRRYGADEVRNVIAVADAGDEMVGVAPTVARYGDKWYLVSSSSMVTMILGIDTNHQAFSGLPGELKTALSSFTPTGTASLPEGKHQGIRYEGSGFKTPEEAVTAYLEGLKNGNVQQMLGAFAWETQAARYSVKDNILRFTQINSSMPARMPSLNGTLDAANLAELRFRQGWAVYNSVRYYVLQDADEESRKVIDGYRLDLKTEEEADGFIRQFDTPRIAKLAEMTNIKVVDAGTIVGEKYQSEANKKTLEWYKQIYGADEIRELIGTAKLGDETVICDPILARYGDRWYIVSVGGTAASIAGIDPQRQAFLTYKGSPEDAAAMFR